MISSEYALSIIDMQWGLSHNPVPPYQVDTLLANVCLLIEKVRQAEVPVLFARHTEPDNSPFSVQSPLTQLLPEMGISGKRDVVFIKRHPSCFQHTDLAYRLTQAGVEQLVIAGMRTEFCVDTTCRAASVLGWRTVPTSDAYSAMGNEWLSAPGIISHHNITFAGLFVPLSAVAEWHFSVEE